MHLGSHDGRQVLGDDDDSPRRLSRQRLNSDGSLTGLVKDLF